MRLEQSAPAWGLIAILGVLTGFDALAIDMYLPAISDIAASFGSEASDVQSSLSVFLIGLALGQVLLGPLADRFGRRGPLLGGVVLFLAASIVTGAAQDLPTFLAGRFAQGLGGAAGIVIPRMIVSELFDRRRGAKIFALLMQVMMIAPIAAPPLGAVLLDLSGWRSIFWALATVSAVALIFATCIVPETLASEQRRPLKLGATLRSYGALLRDGSFALPAAVGALIMTSLFVYIGASAFIFIEHFGLSPQTYSLIFAGASLCLVIAGQVNNRLLDRIGEERLLTGGLIAHVAALVTLVAAITADVASLTLVVALVIVAVSALSFAMGNITAIALDRPAGQSGLAASVFGTAQYALAGIIGTVSATLQGDRILVPAGTMLACAGLALVLGNLSRRRTAALAAAN